MGEMMEVWTMNQLSEIDNAVGLLNIASFYQPFLAFIDHMLAYKFSPPEHRHSICVFSSCGIVLVPMSRSGFDYRISRASDVCFWQILLQKSKIERP
jgi:predicted Rossmann-fold nucleotide-binding protein